jgi:hypothetical protein
MPDAHTDSTSLGERASSLEETPARTEIPGNQNPFLPRVEVFYFSGRVGHNGNGQTPIP